MAEEKSSKGFAKVLTKKVTRTKEKVLAAVGKADKTRDEAFDVHVNNFQKQQAAGSKIQSELKKYVAAVKTMALASRTFYETLRDNYETDWSGNGEITRAVGELSTLWESYTDNIINDVSVPMFGYTAKFPDLKNKISKRGRKLTDFDSARHHHDSLTSAKKKDETKINKAKEELDEAQRIYEDMNTELLDELPALYDEVYLFVLCDDCRRIGFLSHNMNTFFSLEAKFQGESAKVKERMSQVASQLNDTCGGGGSSYVLTNKARPTYSNSRSRTEDSDSDDDGGSKSRSFNLTTPSRPDPPQGKFTPRAAPGIPMSPKEESRSSSTSEGMDDSPVYQCPENNQPVSEPNEDVFFVKKTSLNDNHVAEETGEYETVTLNQEVKTNGEKVGREEAVSAKEAEPTEEAGHDEEAGSKVSSGGNALDSDVPRSPSVDAGDESSSGAMYSMAGAVDDIYITPSSNEAVELPEGVLYQVLATHQYVGTDSDELSFKSGDVINVVEFDDPEEQDDGWFMGYIASTGDRGVFPENFTKRI